MFNFCKFKILKSLIILTLIHICVIWSNPSFAGGFFVKLGPSSLGNGGSNPLTIPPSLIDTELYYVSNSGFEASLMISGLFFGQRLIDPPWGPYISIGGGYVLDVNGAGPGVYSAFGYDFGFETIRFNVEYKQALGIASKTIIAPYSLKIGIGLWFN